MTAPQPWTPGQAAPAPLAMYVTIIGNNANRPPPIFQLAGTFSGRNRPQHFPTHKPTRISRPYPANKKRISIVEKLKIKNSAEIGFCFVRWRVVRGFLFPAPFFFSVCV